MLAGLFKKDRKAKKAVKQLSKDSSYMRALEEVGITKELIIEMQGKQCELVQLSKMKKTAPRSINSEMKSTSFFDSKKHVQTSQKAVPSYQILDQGKRSTLGSIDSDEKKEQEKKYQQKLIAQLNQFTQEKEEEVKQEKIKQGLRIEDARMCYFKCMLSLDFFEQPVLTPCGHYFEKNEITHYLQSGKKECPCCRASGLTINNVVFDFEMKKIVAQVKRENTYFLADIDKIHYLHQLNEYIRKYESQVENIIQFVQNSETRKQRYAVLAIEERIDALKLDIKNPEHLKFWHDQTDHCWHGYGGMLVRQFRIPHRIYRMMQAAEKSYQSKEDFLRAIDYERKGKESIFIVKYIKSFWHKPIATIVYESEDITLLDFRNNNPRSAQSPL